MKKALIFLFVIISSLLKAQENQNFLIKAGKSFDSETLIQMQKESRSDRTLKRFEFAAKQYIELSN